MKASNKNREQTIASEVFRPALSEEYQERFRRLTLRLEDTLPMNRARIISDELRRVSEAARESDLDCQKYMAALSVLVDLSLQGWIFDFQDHQLTLKMENDSIDDKEKIRYRLSAERNAQFKSESVARFIKYMETERSYNGAPVSIRYLIGNKDALILAIKEGRQVCEPYIQMVTGDRDEHSGFKLSDIWRYFRYTWSIPYKTMPGRNIYYLVRDRLQPYHPIIGIFALGNSVLNLTVRDDDIGWTVEAIKKELSQRVHTEYCEQTVSGTDGKTVKVKIQAPIETDEEYLKRRQAYADRLFPLLVKNVNTAISEIYTGDLGYYKQTKYPHREQVDELYAIAAEYSERSINNRNNEIAPDWREEARSNLFKRKRASELAKLLETKIAFNNAVGQSKEVKRKYYFENLDGQGLLRLQPEEIRKSMEIFTSFDSQKKKIKERLVRSINKLFLPSSDDKKQLHIWTTHRYDLSQEAAVAVSSKSVDTSELEIKMPRPADWLQGMEYMPNHIILKPKDGELPVLTLDADFLRTLDAVENGYPVGLLAPQYEQAAAMFLQQLDNYGYAEENDDGEIILASRINSSKKTVLIQDGKYDFEEGEE